MVTVVTVKLRTAVTTVAAIVETVGTLNCGYHGNSAIQNSGDHGNSDPRKSGNHKQWLPW